MKITLAIFLNTSYIIFQKEETTKMERKMTTTNREYSITRKYYTYWVSGMGIVKTRAKIDEAIRLRLRVERLDRIMEEKQIYDYTINCFIKLV